MAKTSKKAPIKVKAKAPKGLFEKRNVGRVSTKPLIHKDGSHYTDIEYFELLGRKVIEIEKANPNPNVPINFQEYGFDRNTCEVAKCVAQAIDDKRPVEEIKNYITSCIVIDE